jgi:hypothetical protein
MYSNKTMKSFVRFVAVTLIGMTVAIGSAFEVNAKEKVSKRALKEMISGAKTAADHKAIAEYYHAEADKANVKAQEHDQMAAWYRTAGEGTKKIPYAPGTIDHCERLVKEYRSVANDLTALAKEHEAMAANVK